MFLLVLAVAWSLTLLTAPAALAKTLQIGGTGSVVTIMAKIRDRFAAHQPDFEIEVLPSLGSSGGIRGVSKGEIQVGFSARPLTAAEEASGLRQQLFLTTPFVLVTSVTNPPAVSGKAIAAYLSGEQSDWPDGTPVRPILRPRTDQDVTLMAQFFPGAEAAIARLQQRVDIPTAPTDQENLTLAQEIAGSLTATTLVQVATERPSLSVLTIDGVTPSLETLLQGDYPYSKIIYLITRPPHDAALAWFLAYLHTDEVARLVAASGAFVLPQ